MRRSATLSPTWSAYMAPRGSSLRLILSLSGTSPLRWDFRTEDWKPLDIKDGADSQLISARIQRWVGGGTEKLVVLELQAAFPAARSVAIRMAPLRPEDRLVTLAYPDQNPRFVSGRFVQYATDGRLAGTALLEMYEGDNRFAIDHGASGAPVFDCEGRIAAVISTVITQIFANAIWRIANFDGMGNTQCRVGAGAAADGIFRSSVRRSGPKSGWKTGAHCWAPAWSVLRAVGYWLGCTGAFLSSSMT